MDYETFEEVADEGQNVIGSRWVITVKEKHDGQKQQCKARLVARGFQESLKPQSDSPTASKDSFKLLMAVAANNGFRLASVDIRAAFLQSKALDRDVFVKPPEDIRKPGIVWRLKKPLYGLDDASRKFWLRVKEVLVSLGLRVMTGDEAFYYLHEDGELKGAVLTHVDDFSLAGDDEFIRKVISQVERQLTVSKVEKDKFRFTGLDISSVEDGIEVTMADYVKSIGDVPEVRNADRDEELTGLEMKEYRKITGKISWLANSTRPDLCYTSLAMSKNNKGATIGNLRDVSRVLKKVREPESKIKYKRIGDKEDLVIVGIGDASYKLDDKAVGGVSLFLANSNLTRASPIYWKSKQIVRVCHSSKDAETLNMTRLVDDATFAARQLELMLYGDYKKRIPVILFTDSESSLESIASSKQVVNKSLRMTVWELKDKLLDGEVLSYAWLPTEHMWADVLTKEMRMPEALEKVLTENVMVLPKTNINEVKAFGSEVRMENIRNPTVKETGF